MKNKKGLQNRDIFERMNFLYQASVMMAGKNNTLSAYFGMLLKNVGKKSVLRMEPDIKRVLCKSCGLYLKSGITSDIKVDQTNKNVFIVICKMCNFKKKYQINSKYKLWIENPDCIVETFKGNGSEHLKGKTI